MLNTDFWKKYFRVYDVLNLNLIKFYVDYCLNMKNLMKIPILGQKLILLSDNNAKADDNFGNT